MKYEQHVESFMHKHPEAPRDVVEKVNQEIDQFAHYPDMEFLRRHRKFLHHVEGAEYFGLKYGEWGRKAAFEHIMQDCGQIPTMQDYAFNFVDEFGQRKYNES